MKDRLRTLFSIRKKRATPPVGPQPKVGSFIILNGSLKMIVTHTIPRELWDWMVLSGWRSIPVARDRRQTKEAPKGTLKELLEASPNDRNAIQDRIARMAKHAAADA